MSIGLSDGRIEDEEEFCYLGDMLDCKGGTELAVRHRFSVAWCVGRDICTLFTNRTIPLKYCGSVYDACVFCKNQHELYSDIMGSHSKRGTDATKL